MPSRPKKHAPTTSTKANPPDAAADAVQPSINWPALSPLLPTADLTLVQLRAGQICTIPRLWTPTLCKTYTSFLARLPLTTTPAGAPKRGHAVRVNDRLQVEDAVFARRLWCETGLQQLLTGGGDGSGAGGEEDGLALREQWGGRVLGLNPNIRIYRYTAGQFFAQHYDESNSVSIGEPAQRGRTTWTLLLYLTSPAEGCVGGETVFYPEPVTGKKGRRGADAQADEPIVVGLQTGMALLHKHGNDCMLHEGLEVKAGEKWVIRSDLCVAAS